MPPTVPPTLPVSPLPTSPAWQAVLCEARRFASSADAQGYSSHLHSVTRDAEDTPLDTPPPFDLRHAFAQDPQRVQRFSQNLHDEAGRGLLHVDYSKSHIDAAALAALHALAQQQQVLALRDAMFAGERINTSEQRQVMHWLLRAPSASGLPPALLPVWQEMDAVRRAFLQFAERIRAQPHITDVVHIGIGGSDLGPQMAVRALQPWAAAQAAGRADKVCGKRFHFVSNIDGHALDAVLQQVHPAHTLFIIASKTFTTLETMTNARSALQWFEAQGGDDVAQHFVGITTHLEAARALGIDTTFGFWDWVGGRYSLWSAIGLPLAIAIGADAFMHLLAGAHAVDQHFAHAPAATNLPLTLGLLDVWYASALGYGSRCIAPYHEGLQRLPAYLQQLEMESNGKACTRHGAALPLPTAPCLWGEPGSNGQHAFFQLLHQSPRVLAVEFIAVHRPTHALAEHHRLLLANALAQAQALMQGRTHADPQRACPGNRPSTFTVLPELSPRTLGALLALYEHRVFVSGATWDINSFDQFGVELGKQLAQDIMPRWHSGYTQGLDASTASLLRMLC